jgi:adenosylcobinamide kinase/adenosylcobinamide-phosphate guanylyltransferase
VHSEKTLVTGGVRSGKSRYAEGLLSSHPQVTYLAPGPVPDPATDPEWANRIALHRSRRPSGWRTVETSRLAEALTDGAPPFLLDCLGTWLTAVVDELGTWDVPLAQWQDRFDARLHDLVQAWQAVPGVAVAVTNEVGMGLVSEHRSGRVFTDLLGRTNQAVAAVSDSVVLVVAGRALRL